jgi:hypothetical protein
MPACLQTGNEYTSQLFKCRMHKTLLPNIRALVTRHYAAHVRLLFPQVYRQVDDMLTKLFDDLLSGKAVSPAPTG